MEEIGMALRMRKEAEEVKQREFWDKQVAALNAELMELRVGGLNTNVKESKSSDTFELGDTRKECETSENPNLQTKSVRSSPTKTPNHQHGFNSGLTYSVSGLMSNAMKTYQR